MKLKINTELEISEDEKNVCERFGITKKEVANHIEFYYQHETLTGYTDIIVELIKDNRLDIICTLATAYLKVTDKSVQPPDAECPECKNNHTGYIDDIKNVPFKNQDCPDCGGTGIKPMIYPPSAICIECNGTGKVKS